MDRARATLKTYAHLAGARRMPSDYELATSQLLYYVERGFAVKTPIAPWYARYQRESPLAGHDWERFRDPRETTYPRYTERQRDREAYVAGLFTAMDQPRYAQALDPAWLAIIEHALFPLRYPLHGVQMIASYVGSMAPSGRIVLCCALEAADQMRRIEHIAFRVDKASRDEPEVREALADEAKERWLRAPAWQSLREVVEKMLVVWDFGEAFTACNLCLLPWLDALSLSLFADVAVKRGDPLLAEVLRALGEDGAWQIAWSGALVDIARESDESTRALGAWMQRWWPLCENAARALLPVFGASNEGDGADLEARARASLGSMATLVEAR